MQILPSISDSFNISVPSSQKWNLICWREEFSDIRSNNGGEDSILQKYDYQSNKFSIYQLVLMLHNVISSVTDGQKY